MPEDLLRKAAKDDIIYAITRCNDGKATHSMAIPDLVFKLTHFTIGDPEFPLDTITVDYDNSIEAFRITMPAPVINWILENRNERGTLNFETGTKVKYQARTHPSKNTSHRRSSNGTRTSR